MTFIYDFYLPNFISEIIYLITFLEFLSFVYINFKLSISSNDTKHSKGLKLYYTLPFFTILKSPYSTGQLTCLKKDKFSFTKKNFLIQKG